MVSSPVRNEEAALRSLRPAGWSRQERSTVMKRTFIAIAAAAATFATAGAAQAEDVTERIEFSPIQLATSAGREALKNRIDDAVESVCSITDVRDLNARREQRACMESAAADAQAQLDSKLATLGDRRLAYVQSITVRSR